MEINVTDYAQLPLVFLGGLLGSSHCVGMCGGFALSVGFGSRTLAANVLRQVTWCSGRIFTYAFGGAACGFFGARLQGQFSFASMQGLLAVAAGVLLMVQGVLAAGLFKRTRRSPASCSMTKWSWLLPIGRLLKPSRDAGQPKRSVLPETFLAGVMTGFLPCGLVYAYLALAAASGRLWSGGLIMLTFGLGTVPVMVATGAGVSLMSFAARTKVLKVAAWCVLLTGLLTLSRGVIAMNALRSRPEEPPPCPLCDEPAAAFNISGPSAKSLAQ